MSRTSRLDISLEPFDTVQAFIIFNELVQYIEDGYTEMVKDNIATGETLTIPLEYQYIIHDTFIFNGDMIIEGTMVIL